MSFGNPLLLAGALAIAVPILIHLFSRRRFRRVRWAATELLARAQKKNRRRIRNEQWIILCLRCLVIALLAFFLARPFLPSPKIAAATGGSTEHIVLLDDSPSMSAMVDGQTVFGRAADALTAQIDHLQESFPNDLFTLVLSSHPNEPLENGVSLSRASGVMSRIGGLEPRDRAANLPGALDAIRRLAERDDARHQGGANRAVTVVSDMREADWGEGPVTEALEKLRESTASLTLIDASKGARPGHNLTITGIEPAEAMLCAGVGVRFEVLVRNDGTADANAVPVSLTVDGGIVRRQVLDLVPAGETVRASFSSLFAEPGMSPVFAELDLDDFKPGNQFSYIAEVHPGRRILLVDGDPAEEFGKNETFFLQRALSPPGDRTSGNLLETIDEVRLPGLDLDNYDLIYLCNVFQIDRETRERLETWVGEGGSLVVTLGDRIVADNYNAELFRDGKGLLPARVGVIAGDAEKERWAFLGDVLSNHPAMRIFSSGGSLFLERTKFFQWWQCEEVEDASVLARFNNPEADPALIEKAFGKGKVVLLASSIDSAWQGWASDPSYLVTMLELASHLVSASGTPRDLVPGEAVVEACDVTDMALQASLSTPAEPLPQTLSAAGEPLAFRFPETDTAGVYGLSIPQLEGGTAERLFAVNHGGREMDLTPLAPGGSVKTVALEEWKSNPPAPVRADLAWIVGCLMALALLSEHFLAWKFARNR